MKILNPKDTLPTGISTIATVGNFDGVHRGHSCLIARTVGLARGRGEASVVVTFEPHTRNVLHPELSTALLTTLDEKAALIEKLGVDYVYCVNFDDNMRQQDQEYFIKNILADKLHVNNWVMGEGHRVGKNSMDGKKKLHFVAGKYHINILTESLETADGAAVSSTRIRKLVSEGRLTEASAMLGHPYLIIAERIAGVKVATELGYPTLNFKCPDARLKAIPPAGIYAAEIEIGGSRTDGCIGAKKVAGALYFGNCPTYTGRETHFEFHALRYSDEDRGREPVIGETVSLWLHKYIRPDAAFENSDMLKAQIGKDINEIKKYFSQEMQ